MVRSYGYRSRMVLSAARFASIPRPTAGHVGEHVVDRAFDAYAGVERAHRVTARGRRRRCLVSGEARRRGEIVAWEVDGRPLGLHVWWLLGSAPAIAGSGGGGPPPHDDIDD